MIVDQQATRDLLLGHDNILILAHQKPDGDTLGAAFALLWGLEALGKKAAVLSPDGFPDKFAMLSRGYRPPESFAPGFIVAVDIASRELMGDIDAKIADSVDLCIDHHKSNALYAKHTLLDIEAPAVCQTIRELLGALSVPITPRIADALYFGLSTDTGCFRYSNTTSKCLRVAAELMDAGANSVAINKLMFNTRSRGMLLVERMMSDSITFYYNDRCAVAVLPEDITRKYGVSEEDLDGISAYTARIEGVYAGVTVRTKPDDVYRVSLRTASPVDASAICARFGGGGHANAAGCTLNGELYSVISDILGSVGDELRRNGLL
jgi:phosphoesterase RecJ-like protein